jgi:hypothetical protein
MYLYFPDTPRIFDIHTTLWWFVICVSAAEIEPETLQILYLNGNHLTALVQNLKISSIKKTSHADLGEELVHKKSC